MKFIVAVDEKWGIGKQGDLLVSIPDDMRYYRETTRGKVVVMGYNTLLSLPRPQPGRLNIVLADIPDIKVSGVVICNTMEQLLALIANFRSDDVFVIGGGMMYRQLMPYCDTAHITKMRFDGEAETCIPNLDEIATWSVSSETDLREHDGIPYSFVTYHNAAPEVIDFTGASTDMARYFRKKPELPAGFADSLDDEGKRKLHTYLHPLPDGVGAEDVARFLSEGDGSFEQYLRDNGFLVAPEDLGLM